MKAFWTYTFARLGIFVAVYAVLYLVTSSFFVIDSAVNLLVLIVAMVISAVISAFALAKQRERLALNIQQRAERMSERIEQSRSAEDID